MILSQDSTELFLGSLSVKGRSDNTIRAYRADLQGLAQWIQVTQEMDLEVAAAKYLNANRQGWKPATTSRKLAAFRAFALFNGDPKFLADYKAPFVAAGIAHPLPGGMDKIREMVDRCKKPDHRVFIILCGMMALRASEARSIRPVDFEFESDGIYLRVRGKGDKTRVVPVTDEVAALLGPTILRTPSTERLISISDSSARRKINRLGAASHDLRMTRATTFFDKTGNLRATQELLGHASSSTTEGYTLVTMKTIRAGLEEESD